MKQQIIVDWPQLITALATLIGAITGGIIAVLAALKGDNKKQAEGIVTTIAARQDNLDQRLKGLEDAGKQRGKHLSGAVAALDQKLEAVASAVDPTRSRP